MNGEFNLAVLIPVRADLELAFSNPLGIVLNDAFDFKFVIEVEFLLSEPDSEQFVPSFSIEPDLAAQILHRLLFNLDNMLPAFLIGHEHAVVLGRPTLGTVSPVGAYRV